MKVRLIAAATVALAGAAALAGCGPSEPFPPVAVQLQGATPQVRYTDCKPAKIKSARIIKIKPGQKTIDGSEPVLWQVHFAQPSSLRELPVGTQPPTGGTLDVPLTQTLDPGTRYEAFLELDNDTNPHQGFQLDKLAGGQVSFQDKYVTQEEFARLTKCS